MDRTIKIKEFPEIDVFTEDKNFKISLEKIADSNSVYIYKFSIEADKAFSPQPITLRWKFPSFDIKGVWKVGGLHDKRQNYDWELEHPTSRISVDAPMINIFGHSDKNIQTIACSDVINLIEMNALLREEDNYEYCHISFFKENHPKIKSYSAKIRVDNRDINFHEAIQDVSLWWETFENLKPHPVPDVASVPLYSTWYQFHQDLDEELLLAECKIAKDVGYELIILDDGWQTMDNNRGYDYTGDWESVRFSDLKGFVEKVHGLGMKFGLWFSVPFCGKHSKAYKKFKGKFLTENHRWAPVFDPRYPEVRSYLIDIYVSALKDYNIDAFKLDFIDDFKVYSETVLTKDDGRDFANVNEAVDKLLSEAMAALRLIKPDIGIEFRQQYVGPALRKYGNMVRAFDCPNDVVSNRIRVTDVKLLCGDTVVHSDPQTWHLKEKVELAALQVLNGFFGVPQMSMMLKDLPVDHLSMVEFYTSYWIKHKHILLKGDFKPVGPLSNYPTLSAAIEGHTIVAVYEDFAINAKLSQKLDIINAKMSTNVILRNEQEVKSQFEKYSCTGQLVDKGEILLKEGIHDFSIPQSGLLKLQKI